MESLPIEDVRSEFIKKINGKKRVVLTAPTGTGKSTQIPQFLLDELPESKGQIIVLQPRRIAARLLAKRVASERRCKVGEEVGYKVRFEDRTTRETKIVYMTEGLFWRKLTQDPHLQGVRAVLFDEFHERHLEGDLALSKTREIQEKQRPDLMICVMSATLETSILKDFLEPCDEVYCDGTSYPVKLMYSEDGWGIGSKPVWERACRQIPKVIREVPEGDILIFMPGAYEIKKTIDSLNFQRETKGFEIVALHGEMPPEKQDIAVKKINKRKIIVSTNVAETSLTIEGVRAVIDSGLAKIARYDSRRAINGLMTERISQASADQRKGRAGRVAEGLCVRLWKESENKHFVPTIEPEIHRMDLAPGILEMLAGGAGKVRDFRWLQKPEESAINNAEQLLYELGATESLGGDITVSGKRMAKFPMHPRYARILIEAEKRACLGLVAQLVALVQGRPFLLQMKDANKERARQEQLKIKNMPGSDFFYLYKAFVAAAENGFSKEYCKEMGIHALAAREAWQVARQFLDMANEQGMDFGDESKPVDLIEVKKCLLAGFPEQVAKRMDQGTLRCLLQSGRRGELRRSSIADNSKLIVVAEIEEQKKKNGSRELFLGLATEIQSDWLDELWPERFSTRDEISFDEKQRRVLCRNVVRFGDLIIEEKPSSEKPEQIKSAELLADAIVDGNLPLKNWNEEVKNWINRVNFFADNCKDYEVCKIDEEAKRMIILELCSDSTSYKEVKHKEIFPILKSWLPVGIESIIDNLTPETIAIPRRKKPVPIQYINGKASISLTIQELMPIPKHPYIAGDTYPLVIEVLAPNRRPVQITTEIKEFFKNSYPQIRKDLRGRYPKHDWPEEVSA